MKQLLNLIKAQLKQAITINLFAYSFVIAILMIILMYKDLFYTTSTVTYLMGLAYTATSVIDILIWTLPILPYGLSLCKETENSAINLWVVRCGITKYTLSKFIVTAISGFLVVFFALAFYTLILLLKVPLHTNVSTDIIYLTAMNEGKTISGFLSLLVHHSLTGSLTATVGLFVSTFITNQYISVSLPIMLNSIVVSTIHLTVNIPYQFATTILNPTLLTKAVHTRSLFAPILVEKAMVIGIIIIFLTAIGTVKMKRRFENDKL